MHQEKESSFAEAKARRKTELPQLCTFGSAKVASDSTEGIAFTVSASSMEWTSSSAGCFFKVDLLHRLTTENRATGCIVFYYLNSAYFDAEAIGINTYISIFADQQRDANIFGIGDDTFV
jgi:hypothetical protein